MKTLNLDREQKASVAMIKQVYDEELHQWQKGLDIV